MMVSSCYAQSSSGGWLEQSSDAIYMPFRCVIFKRHQVALIGASVRALQEHGESSCTRTAAPRVGGTGYAPGGHSGAGEPSSCLSQCGDVEPASRHPTAVPHHFSASTPGECSRARLQLPRGGPWGTEVLEWKFALETSNRQQILRMALIIQSRGPFLSQIISDVRRRYPCLTCVNFVCIKTHFAAALHF